MRGFPLYLARRVETELRASNSLARNLFGPSVPSIVFSRLTGGPWPDDSPVAHPIPHIRSRSTQYLLAAVIGFVPTQ